MKYQIKEGEKTFRHASTGAVLSQKINPYAAPYQRFTGYMQILVESDIKTLNETIENHASRKRAATESGKKEAKIRLNADLTSIYVNAFASSLNDNQAEFCRGWKKSIH